MNIPDYSIISRRTLKPAPYEKFTKIAFLKFDYSYFLSSTVYVVVDMAYLHVIFANVLKGRLS